MAKNHMKRLRVPAFWRVPKKHAKFATKPRPGAHKKLESIPLLVVVRDILEMADTMGDAKKIIKMGEVFVDGKYRKDHKYPAGLMDVVSVPKMKMDYRVVATNKGLELIKIPHGETKQKLVKIVNKRSIKRIGKGPAAGKKKQSHTFQLNLHDGRNMIVDSNQGKDYSAGDTLIVDLPSQKISNHIKLEKGALILIVKGKNIGLTGKVKDIMETKTKEPTKVICDLGHDKLEVIKDYVFVVGKDKPVLKINAE